MPSLGDILNTVLQEARNTRDTLLDTFAASGQGQQLEQGTASFEEVLAKATAQAQVPDQAVFPEIVLKMTTGSTLPREVVLEKATLPAPEVFAPGSVESRMFPEETDPSLDILPRIQEALSSLQEGLSRLVSMVSGSFRQDARGAIENFLSMSGSSATPDQVAEFMDPVVALVKDLPETQNPLLLSPAQQGLIVGQWLQQMVSGQEIQLVDAFGPHSPSALGMGEGKKPSEAFLRFSFQETDLRVVRQDGSRPAELFLRLESFQMVASFHRPSGADLGFEIQGGERQPIILSDFESLSTLARETGSPRHSSRVLSLSDSPVGMVPSDGMNRTFKDLVNLLLQSGVTRAVLNDFMVAQRDPSSPRPSGISPVLGFEVSLDPVKVFAPRLSGVGGSMDAYKELTAPPQSLLLAPKPEGSETVLGIDPTFRASTAHSSAPSVPGSSAPELSGKSPVISSGPLVAPGPAGIQAVEGDGSFAHSLPLVLAPENPSQGPGPTLSLAPASGLPLGLRDQPILTVLPARQAPVAQRSLSVQPEEFGQWVQEALVHSGVVLPSSESLAISARPSMPFQAGTSMEAVFSQVPLNPVQNPSTPNQGSLIPSAFTPAPSLPDLSPVKGDGAVPPVLNQQIPTGTLFEAKIPGIVSGSTVPAPIPVISDKEVPTPAVRTVAPSSHQPLVLMAAAEVQKPTQPQVSMGVPVSSWNSVSADSLVPAAAKPISPEAVTLVPQGGNSGSLNLALDGQKKEFPVLTLSIPVQGSGVLTTAGNQVDPTQGNQPVPVDPRVGAASVLERITDQVRSRTHELRALSHLSFQLIPESLGRVTVQLALVDHAVSAKIIVTRPEVREAIQTNLVELRTALNQAGLQIDQLQVQVQGGGANLLAQYYQYQQEGSGYRLPSSLSDGPEAEESLENKGVSNNLSHGLSLVDLLA